MKLLDKTRSSSPHGVGLSRPESYQPHDGHTVNSSPQKNPTGANELMETPSRRRPDISLVDESVSSEGSAPRGLTNQDAQASDQEQDSQILDGSTPLPPIKTVEKVESITLKDKLHCAWMMLHNSKVPKVDPNFAHLPGCLSNRIDPNKDPLRDKLRRLRRLKIKRRSAAPVTLDKLPQEFPNPIHWSTPVIKRDEPRLAPTVKPQMFFYNTGPAFDEYENPFGGEHSVLYENERDREERNQATQRALQSRAVSDRFLARRGQRHLVNHLIGRAPPLSKRYIQEEMQRHAWETKETPRVVVAELENKVTPRVVVEPQNLGLPEDGAGAFQWDRAILSKKSAPNFHAQKEIDEDYCHSVSLEATKSILLGQETNQIVEDGLRCEAQKGGDNLTISNSVALVATLVTKMRITAESTNPVSLDCQSGLPLACEETGASTDNQSDDDSSNYSKEFDSDDFSPVDSNSTVENNSEHHAETYRREIEILSASEPDNYTLSRLSDPLEVTTQVTASQLQRQRHTAHIPDFAADISVEHTKTERGKGLVLFADVSRQ